MSSPHLFTKQDLPSSKLCSMRGNYFFLLAAPIFVLLPTNEYSLLMNLRSDEVYIPTYYLVTKMSCSSLDTLSLHIEKYS